MKNTFTKAAFAIIGLLLFASVGFANNIPTITLSGRVVWFSGGQAVPRAGVNLQVYPDSSWQGPYPFGFPFSLTTDSIGQFSLPNLPFDTVQGVTRGYYIYYTDCNQVNQMVRVSSTGGPITIQNLIACFSAPRPNSASIGGSVNDGVNTLLDNYTVAAFKLGSNFLVSQNVPSGSQYFKLSNLPSGSYILWAALNASNPLAANFFPTFASSTTTWASANVVQLADGDSTYQGIGLVAVSSNTGAGQVNGTINGDTNTNATARTAYSITFNKNWATVILKNVANNTDVLFSKFDANGNYSLSGVPYGTYQVRLEYPKVTAAIGTITLSAASPTANVNFNVSSSGVTTKLSHSLADGKTLSLYPNPAKDLVKVNALNDEITGIKIFNAIGVEQKVNAVINLEGADLILNNLPKGIYNLVVSTASQKSLTTKLVKE